MAVASDSLASAGNGLSAFLSTFRRAVGGLLIAASSLASSVWAEDAEPGKVHRESSRVYIHVGKVGLGHEHAVAGLLKSGELDFDTGRGTFVFDMSSFKADEAQPRKYLGLEGTIDEDTRKQVDANMLGELVLDVAKYPIAELKIDDMILQKADDKGRVGAKLNGTLTLHETTKPVVIEGTITKERGWWHLVGSTKILQTNYGIKPFSKFLGTVGVTDELKIVGDMWIAPK